ncbi:hypothetical protein [Klebsiella pneumoniae]|nr:hypothetical protein [Klebsiella pneumoniae]
MIIVQHPNPIAPVTTSSGEDLLNAYQQKAAMIRGEVQQQVDTRSPIEPAVNSQQQAQQQHAANIEQYLSPIAQNQYDVTNAHTEEKQKRFEKSVENDPAFKEVAPEMIQTLEPLRQAVMQGKLDMNQARQIFAQWGQDRFDKVMDKHHGKHSESHQRRFSDTSWIQEGE